jgi:ComF family protein
MSERQLLTGLKRLFGKIFAVEVCLACGHEIGQSHSFCNACSQRLEAVPTPCQYCAQINVCDGPVCPACLLNPPRWQKMIAPLKYQGLVRDYLIQLKYAEALYLANSICMHSIEHFRQGQPKPEVLLPVPLHPRRLIDRGYNQAAEIARIWSREFGIPVDRHALLRRRHTPSQSGLSANQREQNTRQAFSYTPTVAYRHVAIVDDIVTTGSTVNEITKVLHRQGVEFVEVWALARVYRD